MHSVSLSLFSLFLVVLSGHAALVLGAPNDVVGGEPLAIAFQGDSLFSIKLSSQGVYPYQ